MSRLFAYHAKVLTCFIDLVSGWGFQTHVKVLFFADISGSIYKADRSESAATSFHSVRTELSRTRCLHSFHVPPSLFSCLPILRGDGRVPLLPNEIKAGGWSNLSVRFSRKSGERRLSLPGCHISSAVHWRITSHIVWILSGMACRGWGTHAGVSPGLYFKSVS